MQPKRMSQQSFSSESDSYDFWGRDMYDLLKRDVTLRTEIGSYFEKTDANEGIMKLVPELHFYIFNVTFNSFQFSPPYVGAFGVST